MHGELHWQVAANDERVIDRLHPLEAVVEDMDREGSATRATVAIRSGEGDDVRPRIGVGVIEREGDSAESSRAGTVAVVDRRAVRFGRLRDGPAHAGVGQTDL